VLGHSGQIVIGDLANKTIIAMKGRFHAYEGESSIRKNIYLKILGYPSWKIALPIRMMKYLGCKGFDFNLSV